jgi:hypothetical protein
MPPFGQIKLLEGTPIKPVQPVDCTDPNEPMTILIEAAHRING